MSSEQKYIWGYQPHYRAFAQSAAEGIFKLLDPALNPTVFLVGISTFSDDGRVPNTVLDPEDECGYQPETFASIKDLAKQLELVDEESKLRHSHPVMQENHEKRLKTKSLKMAINRAIESEAVWKDVVTFCSYPVEVKGFLVSVVLELNKKVFDSYYRLTKTQVMGRYPIATSLIDATIQEYLSACAKALTEEEPGKSHKIITKDIDEIIRTAGKVLMYTPAWAGNVHSGLYTFFESCNVISSHKYEGEEAIGGLIVAEQNHPNVHMTLTLRNPENLRNHRAVRKLLEIANDESYLITDTENIYGIGNLKGQYTSSNEDLFVVNFVGHYFWELTHAENVLMRVKYGQPSLMRPVMDRTKFADDLRRIFEVTDKRTINNLWLLAEEATRQKHGAMLIFSLGASQEAERLSQQSTAILPTLMTPELLRLVTGIDGGVMIAPDGICYAIGVILDGIATTKGDPSRGSRYNSAVRYIETTEYPCLILVVSEDGMIDFVPNLNPQIKRSVIIAKIDELKALSIFETIEPKTFYGIREWIKKHSFYLSQVMCDEINNYCRTVQPKLEANLRIVYNDLSPHPDMNDSYYIPE